MKGLDVWLFVDLVPCVRSTDPYQHIVFRSEVSRDLTLSFASKFSAYEHIYQAIVFPPIKTELGSHSYDDVVRSTSRRIDYDVGYLRERINRSLGRISANVRIGREFAHRRNSRGIPIRKDGFRCGEMHVYNSLAECAADSFHLRREPDRIDEDARVVWKIGNGTT